ncbi:sugar phosphate nucleotidyltransferase, partial [Acinetobacter baumannii]
IWVTLHYRAEDIASALRDVPRYREHVECIVEEKPLGTAGGLTLLPERPASPFLVMNADLLCEVPLAELRRFHQREGNVATLATREDHY